MPDPRSPRYRRPYALACAIALGLIVAAGLWTKLGYQGWGQAWVRNSSGGILYEMAWIMLIGLLWPHLRGRTIAVGVFTVTAVIEVSQLIPFPQALVTNLLWRLLMGTTFVWWDFLYYGLGCLLGWGLLVALRQRYRVDLGRNPSHF